MCIKRQRGLSLIELIVFIIIVGVSLAGVLSVFTTAARSSADPVVAKQALAVAESLLEEIQLKDFSPPAGGYSCPTAPTCDRTKTDDVMDYNGYTSAGVKDINGTSIPALAGYAVTVSVTTPAAAIGGVPAANIRLITVTVAGSGQNVSLSGYKFNY